MMQNRAIPLNHSQLFYKYVFNKLNPSKEHSTAVVVQEIVNINFISACKSSIGIQKHGTTAFQQQTCHTSLPLTHCKSGFDPKFLKRFQGWIQSKSNFVIVHIQCLSLVLLLSQF